MPIGGSHERGSSRIDRRTFLTVVGGATTAGLSGCLGDGDGGTGENGTTTVTFWSKLSGGDGAVMKSMVERFNEEHDAIQIERERIPTGSFNEKLFTSFTGSEGPDLATVNGLPLYQNAEQFQPFDPFVDSSLLDEYYDTMLQRGAVDGEQFALPLDAVSGVIYYNKDTFEEAGLDPEAPPTAHQEFVDACDAIRENTDKKAFSPVAIRSVSVENLFFEMLHEADGSYLSGDKRTVQWDSDVGIEQARWINSIAENGWDTPEVSENKGIEGFQSGELAIFNGGTWFFNVIQETDMNWGTFHPEFSPAFRSQAAWAVSNLLAVPHPSVRSNSDEARTEAAIEAAQWLTQQVEWPRDAGHVPAYRQSGESSDLQDSPAYTRQIEPLVELAEGEQLRYHPRVMDASYRDPLVNSLSNMYSGNVSPEEAITGAAEQAQDVLDSI